MKYWIFWRYIWFPTHPGETKVFFRSWTFQIEHVKCQQAADGMNDSSNPCVVPARNSFQCEWLKAIRCMQICISHLFFWGVVFNVGWGSSLLILRIAFLNSYCLAVLGESCWLNRDGSILLEEKFDFSSWDRSSSGSCLQAYKTATVGTKSRSCRCCKITKLTADALV